MRGAVNRLLSACAGIAAGIPIWVASPVSAAGEEGARAGEDRWVPSLAVVSGVTIQNQEASVASADVTNGAPLRCNIMDALPPFPCIIDGDDLAVSPYVGANFQLMTPAIAAVPGRPRLFVNGEILPTFAAERNVAKEGDPTGFTLPNLPFGSIAPFAEVAIGGQGSATRATVGTLAFGAALGIAFPFELEGRPLRVKPSAGWIRYEVDVEGRVLDAICLNDGADCNENSTPAGFRREVELGGKQSQWFDAIGPGLEIEMETGRLGPFGTALFVGGGAYRVLGNRTVRFADTTTVPVPPLLVDPIGPATDYAAAWSFEVDPWIYRASVGLRFQWFGATR